MPELPSLDHIGRLVMLGVYYVASAIGTVRDTLRAWERATQLPLDPDEEARAARAWSVTETGHGAPVETDLDPIEAEEIAIMEQTIACAEADARWCREGRHADPVGAARAEAVIAWARIRIREIRGGVLAALDADEQALFAAPPAGTRELCAVCPWDEAYAVTVGLATTGYRCGLCGHAMPDEGTVVS